MNWLDAVDRTVTALGYELVDSERSARGLLRIYIDRQPGHSYDTGPGEFVTVDDCEKVTRQLQHVLEVEGCAYERLEVSSPGLDRPLKREADYRRFAGQEIELTLKAPLQGRRKYRGLLQPAETAGAGSDATPDGNETTWRLEFLDGKTERELAFSLHEVREARLVPVIDFKGRRGPAQSAEPSAADQEDGGPRQ